MSILDITLVILIVTALLRGHELGFVRQAASTTGIIIGTIAGIFVQSRLVGLVHTPSSKTLMAMVVMTSFVMIFSTGGHLAGDLLRGHIDNTKRKRAIDRIDRISGAVAAFFTFMLIVWVAASVFKNVPDTTMQKQIRGSFIISQVQQLMPDVPGFVAKLGFLINPNAFPEVFTGLEPRIDTSRPLPSIGEFDDAVEAARKSVVKIEGVGCGGISQGSGFVAAKNLVITNAHVIAGVKQPIIVDGNGQHKATVVHFDPGIDLAILQTSDLQGEPLGIIADEQPSGVHAAVLGYPNGGDFMPLPATIIERFNAIGQNIYNQASVERDVYSVQAAVQHGNSGGPLIDKDGNVIGVMFAESTTNDAVGYALTTNALGALLASVQNSNVNMDTGSCTQ